MARTCSHEVLAHLGCLGAPRIASRERLVDHAVPCGCVLQRMGRLIGDAPAGVLPAARRIHEAAENAVSCGATDRHVKLQIQFEVAIRVMMVDFHGLEQVAQVFEIFVGQAKRCLRGNCRLEDQTGFVKLVEQAPNVRLAAAIQS